MLTVSGRLKSRLLDSFYSDDPMVRELTTLKRAAERKGQFLLAHLLHTALLEAEHLAEIAPSLDRKVADPTSRSTGRVEPRS